MSAVKVYGATISTCTVRVLFTAFELGHPVDLVSVDIFKGEQKQLSHIARQPFGKVPAMQDGDFWLYESRAICRYLVDKYAGEPTVKLVPSEIKKRAVFEQWMSLEATTYTPEVATLLRGWYASLRGTEQDTVASKHAVENLARDGVVLNKQLEGKQWIANDEFSLVDICLLSFIFPMVDEPEIQDWFKQYPNIAKWFLNITARPAWQKVNALHKW